MTSSYQDLPFRMPKAARDEHGQISINDADAREALIPVLLGEVYGWKAYHLTNDFKYLKPPARDQRPLRSLSLPRAAHVGVSGSTASQEKPHVAPMFGCTCGYYVYPSLRDLHKRRKQYFASDDFGAICLVKAWGKIILHETGLRASHIEICRIYTYNPVAVKRLRETYGPVAWSRSKLKTHKIPNRFIPKGGVDLSTKAVPRLVIEDTDLDYYEKGVEDGPDR